MCTILFSWKTEADYKLVLLANRDEFHERGTKTSHWWEDHPDVLGGRDLKAGGTWMGINRNGRFAAITNYRRFPLESYETSRGDLVKNYLIGKDKPHNYMDFLSDKGHLYDGFNLIFGNADSLLYFSNRGPEKILDPDLYGLSNHLLDSPWPKVERGKVKLAETLKQGKLDKESMFSILADDSRAQDEHLPDTGIGLEKERMLSSIFIKSPNYGTRLSSYLTIDRENNVAFHERSFLPQDEKEFRFKID